MKKILCFLSGLLIGAGIVGYFKEKRSKYLGVLADKHLSIMKVYDQWLLIKQEGKSLAAYLQQEGYNEIAIYGMSFLGERLYSELKDSDVKVKYAIDKRADNIYSKIDVFTPDDRLEKVDAIIVTSNYYFDEIEDVLIQKVNYPIINLKDILFEL